MGEVIELDEYFESAPDVGDMDRDELAAFLRDIKARLAALNRVEPEDMESGAYDDWADRHEALEDMADEAMDRLDELDGKN